MASCFYLRPESPHTLRGFEMVRIYVALEYDFMLDLGDELTVIIKATRSDLFTFWISTWEFRCQLELLHWKKVIQSSLFAFLVFWRFWHMTCFIIAPPCHKTHIHSHTQADHRGVICHQSATSSLWASAWATTLSILHGNLPASIFPFRHFIALFAYFLSYFNFGFPRVARRFAKYLRFLWPDPPAEISLAFAFKSTHPHTLPHSLPLALSHSDTRTHPLSAACHYRKRRPGCP